MTDMKALVVVDLDGNLPREAQRFDRAFGRMAQGSRSHAAVLRAAGVKAGDAIDRIGNRWVALAAGAGAAGTLRYLGNLDQRLRALGVQANAPVERIEALKDRIFEVANAPDIRVDPAQLLDAVDKIVEKTGNLDLAEANLENIGLAMRAASAEGVNVGAMIADLDEKFRIDGPEQMRATLDALVNQGKEGAFTLQNLATQGERVTAAYGQFGRTGPQAAREMGAALQLIRKGTGSAEQAATALEAVVRTLNDAQKSKMLTGAGIKLIDPADPNRMRSILSIMEDIIRATNGDVRKISSVFDAEAMRAFSAAIVEFKQTGGLASIDTYMSVNSDGVSLLGDAKRNAEGFTAAVQSLRNSAQAYAETNLAGTVQDLASAIDQLDPSTVNAVMDAIAKGALAAAGLFAVTKAVRGVRAVLGGVRALRGAGAGAAAAGAVAAGAMPVIVTNWPAGFGAGQAFRGGGRSRRGAKAGAGRALATLADNAAGRGFDMAKVPAAVAGKPGFLARLMGGGFTKGSGFLAKLFRGGKSIAGKVALPLTAALSAVDIGMALAEGDYEGAAGAGGALGGALAGGALGATVGSVVPGVGTAVGGIAGSVIGGIGGESAVRSLFRLLVGVDPENGQVTVRTVGNPDNIEFDPGAVSP